MQPNMSPRYWVLVGVFVSGSSLAEQFDYEISLGFDRSSFDGSELLTTPGGSVLSSSSIDTDDLSLIGDWYFAGLSDDKGPRARAAFADRASSFGIGYLRSDQSTSLFLSSNDPTIPVPSIDTNIDADGDSFVANLRYVDRDSGWFGNAGLLTSKTSVGGIASDSSDATGWSLGVGKYIFETTAIGLDLSDVDGESGSDASIVSISFTHLGKIGENWQYAVDLGYSQMDSDNDVDLDTLGATLALYPTSDFEFGISIEDVSADGGTLFDLDTTGIEGFASWFVTPRFQLSARYRVDDVSFPSSVFAGGAITESDADQDSFGIGATFRF